MPSGKGCPIVSKGLGISGNITSSSIIFGKVSIVSSGVLLVAIISGFSGSGPKPKFVTKVVEINPSQPDAIIEPV